MKNFIPLLISGILVTGAVGCGEEAANTGSENPSATNEALQPSAREASETEGLNQPLGQSGSVPGAETAPKDPAAVSEGADALTSDLSKEVSKKLKENLPASNLEVKEQEGVVTVGGTVSSQEELQQVEPLTKGVKGVKGVNVEANVEGAVPGAEGAIPVAPEGAAPEGTNPQ
ncbi:putative periplasmic or secreted lipoprotein [Rivularia sp. PCC 7116]|uniref:BON domain-containing protein n=1 Tax=Rivularia sp. PCC 7116 TaxID=373994 RepID=UPI00029ED84C|nr:BON domain-containing protein [Rivularia sp. PCC 7116]AFY58398.1 putative periplasmic or secreted lipoprotein [Rivularia sp. PCC 7116]